MSSSDSEAENIIFLSRCRVEKKETNRTGRLMIWADGYRYVFAREISKIQGISFFSCWQKVKNRRAIYQNCKGKGFVRLNGSFLHLPKDHCHDSKTDGFEIRRRLQVGYDVAEASPISKTRYIIRSVKRGASRQIRAAIPKYASISRQIQRRK